MWKIYDQSEKLSVVDHMFAPKMIELPETVGKIEYTKAKGRHIFLFLKPEWAQSQ